MNFAGSGETYVVNPGIEYYADGETIAGTMQDFDIFQCGNMVTNQTAILRDSRDGKTYSIVKMADGNCWMNQNLRLGTPGQSITLTSADSDVTSNYTINSSDIQTIDGVDWSADIDVTHVYSFAENSDVSDDNKITYGNLYNWYTATASTGTTSVIDGADAPSSICPKGWKLPPNVSNDSYANLIQTQIPGIPTSDININYTDQFQQAPLNLVLSGAYVSSNTLAQGIYGSYWSRTSHSIDDQAMGSTFNNVSGDFYLYNNRHKHNGLAVRCVLPATMQGVTNATVANATDGVTTTLKDYRDGQDYTVAKINGNLWMTRNLAIGCNGSGSTYGNTVSSKSLTDADSNVSSAWSTPTELLSNSELNEYANGYTTATIQCGSTYGAWYNYVAATTGVITGNSNSTDAVYDICPKNWRLFTQYELNELISSIGSTPSMFGPVLGGFYFKGSINAASSVGGWWTATSSNNSFRKSMRYNGSNLSTSGDDRIAGLYVRCIHS